MKAIDHLRPTVLPVTHEQLHELRSNPEIIDPALDGPCEICEGAPLTRTAGYRLVVAMLGEKAARKAYDEGWAIGERLNRIIDEDREFSSDHLLEIPGREEERSLGLLRLVK